MTCSRRGVPYSQSPGRCAIRPGLFTKGDFKIDLRAKTITCPAGEVEPFEPGETASSSTPKPVAHAHSEQSTS